MLAALCGSDQDIIKSRHGALSLLLRFPLRCPGSFLRRVRNNLIWNTAGTERPWMFFTWHHYKDIIKSSQRACGARLCLRARGTGVVKGGYRLSITHNKGSPMNTLMDTFLPNGEQIAVYLLFFSRQTTTASSYPHLHIQTHSAHSRGGGGVGILFAARSDGRCEYQPWMSRSCTSLSVTTCSQTRCASTRSYWEASVSELFCLESYTLRDLPFFAAMHLKDPNYFWLMFRYTAPVVIARFPFGIQRRFRFLSRADIWKRGSLLRDAGNRNQRHQ